jgi:hypothetical protein
MEKEVHVPEVADPIGDCASHDSDLGCETQEPFAQWEAESEAQMPIRRRLLSIVAEHMTEGAIRIAEHAIRDLLLEAPEITKDLLTPIFEWSDYWPEMVAKEILGLPADEDYRLDEVIEMFQAKSDPGHRPGAAGE